MTKPGRERPGFVSTRFSGWRDVRSLRAFLPLRDLECDLLAIIEGLVALEVDRGEVHEEVFATFVGLDETKALVRVEPLNGAGRHGDASSVLRLAHPS